MEEEDEDPDMQAALERSLSQTGASQDCPPATAGLDAAVGDSGAEADMFFEAEEAEEADFFFEPAEAAPDEDVDLQRALLLSAGGSSGSAGAGSSGDPAAGSSGSWAGQKRAAFLAKVARMPAEEGDIQHGPPLSAGSSSGGPGADSSGGPAASSSGGPTGQKRAAFLEKVAQMSAKEGDIQRGPPLSADSSSGSPSADSSGGPAAGSSGGPTGQKRVAFLAKVAQKSAEETDIQRAPQLSVGSSSGNLAGGSSGSPAAGSTGSPVGQKIAVAAAAIARMPTEEAELQRAAPLSAGGSSGSPAAGSSGYPAAGSSGYPAAGGSGGPAGSSSGSPAGQRKAVPAAAVARMPAEARELVKKVVMNLLRAAEADCDPEQATKFRQLNDGAVRRKVQQSAAPDKAYAAVVTCLQSLGFVLQDAEGADARWVLPAQAAPAKNRLQEMLSAASVGGARPISEAASSADAGPGAAAGSAAGCDVGSAAGDVAGGAAGGALVGRPDAGYAQPGHPLPRSLADFDVLELGRLQGFPYLLKLFVYPKNYVHLVGPSDCVAWASTMGASGRGRRGEDDRVMLTVFSGFGPGDAGCAAQWFNQGGKEQGQPMRSWSGGWDSLGTYISHTFVLRALPQLSVDLCAVKVVGRPYETDGHLVLMLLPAHVGEGDVLRQAGQVVAALPEDRRERPQQPQGRPPPPPPPGWRNNR